MKVTTKGRYGLKAMIDIALATENNKCISLKTISARHGISDGYLEQLIMPLKKAELVVSTRGPQGGYLLGRNSEEISAGDVLRALEGPLLPVECIESGAPVCGTADCSVCSTKSVWGKMYNSLNSVVDSITLKDLSDDARLKGDALDE